MPAVLGSLDCRTWRQRPERIDEILRTTRAEEAFVRLCLKRRLAEWKQKAEQAGRPDPRMCEGDQVLFQRLSPVALRTTISRTLSGASFRDLLARLVDSSFGSGNNAFNHPNGKALSSNDQPFVLLMGFTYEIPAAFKRSRPLRELSGGWTVSGLVRHSSGAPILSPGSRNNLSQVLFQGTVFHRVSGEPLYLRDLNCSTGCIDPNKDVVLNPKAWSDAAPGEWGTAAACYSDYR